MGLGYIRLQRTIQTSFFRGYARDKAVERCRNVFAKIYTFGPRLGNTDVTIDTRSWNVTILRRAT